MNSGFDTSYIAQLELESQMRCPFVYIPQWMFNAVADFTNESNRRGDVTRWRDSYSTMSVPPDYPVSVVEAILALAQRFHEFGGATYAFWVQQMVWHIDKTNNQAGFLPGIGSEWDKMCVIAKAELGLI